MARKTAQDPKRKRKATPPPAAPIAASYDSTGGAGTNFEIDVVVQLLAALLAEAGDRLLPTGWVPRSVRVQRRDGPRGFDDITVEAGVPSGNGAPVYLQVKRSFSLAAENGEFKDYVRSLHARDADDVGAPWLAGLVAGKLTPAVTDVQALTEWARSASSDEDFVSKCAPAGVLNAGKRAVIAAITAHLDGLAGASPWRVLRRLRVAEADYADESSRDAEQLRERLATLLEPGDPTGEDLRQALRGRVLRDARRAPTYTRMSLLAELDGRYRFVALPRVAPDLARLDAETAHALSSIDTSIAGISLLRTNLYAKTNSLGSQTLRIVGDGGCGKSMILRRIATTAASRVVIKDDRVSGRTWAEYAGHLGVTLPADRILEALGERPGALLAIDGADRLLSSERRGVVLDLLRALSVNATRAHWRIVTTARDVQARDLVRDALLEVGLEAGDGLAVGGLDHDDATFLVLAVPALGDMLLRSDLGGRNRDLFTLREAWIEPDARTVGSEVGLAGLWATRGDRATPPVPGRATALSQIGDQILAKGGGVIGRSDLDPKGLGVLLEEGSLRAAPHRDALVFAHDIYEDWALARAFDRRRAALPDLLRAADQPLWWLRAVRLAGQIALETSGPQAWLDLVQACFGATDLDPVWWRTLLVAPLYSERAVDLLSSAEALLLADDSLWLERLIDTLQILESRPDEGIFERATGSAEERQRLAAAFPIPSLRSWNAFFRWGEGRWSNWTGRLVPKLAQLANTWLRATEGAAHRTARVLMESSERWLIEIEEAQIFVRWEDRRPPFGHEATGDRLWEETARLLRGGLAYGVGSAPEVVKAYLARATARDRDRACDDLLKMPRRIPSHLPRAWTDFCIARFAPRRPRIRHKFRSGPFSTLELHDAGLKSLSLSAASPGYAGFDQLFEADPSEALRMLRVFEKRASVFYRHFARQHDGRRPRPVRVQFPWGEVPLWGDENTYRWARGVLGPEVLGSAYMALDLWMGHQAAQGRPLEELFRLVLRPHGLNATLCPCINVAVEHINTPGQIGAVGPILAEPRVWNFEVRRYSDDLTFARQPMVPYHSTGHRPAILEVGARYAKRLHLRADLALAFLLKADEAAQSALDARVASWSAADLANFENELEDTETMAAFDQQLARYRADLDRAAIRFDQVGDQIQVSIAPPEPLAGQIAALDKQQAAFNAASRIMLWGVKSLDEEALQPSMELETAIAAAQAYDAAALFGTYSPERFNEQMAAQGVAATAAIVARLAPDSVLDAHRAWVTETLIAAAQLAPGDPQFDIDEAFLSHDPRTSAARGLGALWSRDDRADLASYLLLLATDRRHHIAAAALLGLDRLEDPRRAWAIVRAAFADTQYDRGKRWWEPDLRAAAQDRQRRREKAFREGLADIQRRRVQPLPPPPPPYQTFWAWRKSLRAPLVRGVRPFPVLFHWGRVKTLLPAVPLKLLAADRRSAAHLSRYLRAVAGWAKAYSEDGPGAHDARYPHELMGIVGKVSGRLAAFTAEATPGAESWRAFTIFEERDHAMELVGDFLEGMTEALVASGEAPSAAFWSVWDPAAQWVLGPPGRPPRGSRHSLGGLGSPTAAAGFVGPYMSPIPRDWPHVAALLPRIDAWAERTQGSAAAADALLRFTDRLSDEQIEIYAYPWIERWIQLQPGDAAFWQYQDLVDRAAGVVLRLQPADRPPQDMERQRRVRFILGQLADRGSLAARQALTAVAGQRPAGA